MIRRVGYASRIFFTAFTTGESSLSAELPVSSFLAASCGAGERGRRTAALRQEGKGGGKGREVGGDAGRTHINDAKEEDGGEAGLDGPGERLHDLVCAPAALLGHGPNGLLGLILRG